MIPKFRAWDKIAGIMRYDLNLYNISILANSVTNQVFMQWTRVQDMNGTDIYEEDIIRKEECSSDDPSFGCYGIVGVVKYYPPIMGFIIDTFGTGDTGFYDNMGTKFSFDEIKVIGNIYENPETLE